MKESQNNKELKNILENILEQLTGNEEKLKDEALQIADEILNDIPFDLDTRIVRIRLNLELFDNIDSAIEDAEFIANNKSFGEDRILGFDWLNLIYNDVLDKPDEALKILNSQYEVISDLYDTHYEKKEQESYILNKIAFHTYNQGEVDKALEFWEKSYNLYHFIHERNAIVGMFYLEKNDWDNAIKFLLSHYDFSYDTEDGYRLEYGQKLKHIYMIKVYLKISLYF